MAIRRIILHIGRHKSGTSSLQHFFSANRKFLDAQGVLYPVAGTPKGAIAHHKLSRLCHIGFDLEHTIKSIAADVGKEVQSHHHTLLFSSEEFQNLASTKWVKTFIRQFPGVTVDIICYVREFADYMVSSYRQAIQNQSKFQTFSKFCENRYPARGFIRRWKKIGDLQLGWFHRDLLKNGDIIEDFLEKIGLAIPDDYTAQNRNPSLGGNLLWMKLAANYSHSLFLPYGDMTKLMLKRPAFTRPFYFSSERANALRHKSSYNKTFTKILGPVPLKFWDDDIHLPDLQAVDDDLDFIQGMFPYLDLYYLKLNETFATDWF